MNVFKDDIQPTLKLILMQCAIVLSAYTGFDLDLISYMYLKEDMDCIFIKNGCFMLSKLISLLFLKQTQDPTYKNDKVDYETHRFSRLSIDLNQAHVPMKIHESSIGIQTAIKTNKNIKFEGLHIVSKLVRSQYISLPIKGSPATLSLFFHMGPSPYKNDDMEVKGLCQNFYAQPHFNHRGNVNLPRFNGFLETCKGRTNFDLTTHQVAVVPYCIASKYTSFQHDISNPRFGENKQNFKSKDKTNISAFPITTGGGKWGDVQSCYTTSEAQTDLFGIPVAKPIDLSDVKSLFEVLFGMNSFVKVFSVESDYEQYICDETDMHHRRMKTDMAIYLLFQLLHEEYNNFIKKEQWSKLYWRMTMNLGKYAVAMVTPTSVEDLVYQCRVMIQATTNFRLACLEGLGRHLVATHCLLGMHPQDGGNLQNPSLIQGLGKMDYNKLCQSNSGIRMYDFGLQNFSTKEAVGVITVFSGQIQHRQQTLSHTDVHALIDTWCTHVNNEREKYVSMWNNPEFEVETQDRTNQWYCDATFKDHIFKKSELALKFVMRSIETGVEHHSYLNTIINERIALHTQDKTKPDVNDLIEIRTHYVSARMLEDFKKGYILKYGKMYEEYLTDLVNILSNAITGDPERVPLENIATMALQCGRGYHIWENEDEMYYPSTNVFLYSSGLPFVSGVSNVF